MKRLARPIIVVLAVALSVPLLEATAQAAPPAPTITNPTNGSNQPTNPVLSWNPSPGATSYRIQISSSATFAAGTFFVDGPTVNTNFVPVNDLPQGPIYWRVNASDANGTSAFTTANFNKTAPTAPTLQAPVNNATLQYPQQPLIFQWNPMAGAAYYQLDIGLDPLFSTVVQGFPANTYQTSYTLTSPLTFGQTFYWRVRSFSGGNLPSQHSAVRQFSITWNEKPTQVSPPNQQNPAVEDYQLEWNWLAGSTSYDLQISTDINFNSLVVDTNVRSTKYARNPHLVAASYFWRVRGRTANAIGQWSEVWTFSKAWPGTCEVGTSCPNPHYPSTGPNSRVQLTYPGDGQFVPEPTFKWTPFRKASHYEVQVSGDPTFATFANCITHRTEFTSMPGCLDSIAPDTIYYWRVRPVDAPTGVLGLFSALNQFGLPQTFVWSPPTVQLTGPANGATVADPMFTWTHGVIGAYKLTIVRNDASFTPIGTATTYNNAYVPQLTFDAAVPANNSYRWYVNSVFPSGADLAPDPSTWRTFTLSQPTIFSGNPNPTIGPVTDMITPPLRWNRVTNATSYTLQYLNGGWLSIAQGLTQPGYANPNQDIPVGTYAWRVLAFDAGNNLLSTSSVNGQFTITVFPVVNNLRAPAHCSPSDSRTVNDGVLNSTATIRSNTAAFTLADIGAVVSGTGIQPGSKITSITNGTTAVLDKPTTASANNVQLIIGGCGASTLLDTPTFKFDPVAGATSYQIILATDPNFTNITGSFTTVQTRLTPTASFADSQAGQATYWFVRACSSNQNHCGFGPEVYNGANPPIFAFRKQSKPVTTTGPGLLMPDPQNPPANPPELPDQITFSWEDYLTTNTTPNCTPVEPPTTVCPKTEATVYVLEVSALTDFTQLIEQVFLDDNFYTAPGLTYPEGPLYWRVRAVDQSNNLLTRSTPRLFIKKSSPLTLTSPPNSLTPALNQLPVFQWQPQNHAAAYEIEVHKNIGQPLNPSNVVLHAFTTFTAWTTTGFLPSGDYGWRMRRIDAGNQPGPWSANDNASLRKFAFAGQAVTLVSPADNAIIGTNSLLFQWSPVAGANSYQFQSSPQANFAALTDNTNTVATGFAPVGVYPDGKYFWRVNTLDANGSVIGTSAVRSFTRGIPPLSEPLNVQAVAGDSQATITWQAPVNNGGNPITKYTVTSSPGNATCTWTSGPLTCVVSLLANGTSYTFTVKATTSAGTSPASAPSNAVTPQGGPGAPTNVAATPGVGAANITWTAPTNTGGTPLAGYTVTASPGGQTCTTVHPTVTCQIAGLTNGTSYTFIVKAKNTAQIFGVNSLPSNPVTPTTADYFHAVDPARIQDSRPTGPQVGPYGTPWGNQVSRTVKVTGVGGVPAGADAVTLNVTVTNATAASFLTIYPAGATRPLASSLNFVSGQTIPNAVTVKVGTSGNISVFNSSGNVDVIIDVVGYYDAIAGDGFTSLTPSRIQDSRPGGPQVGPYGTPWSAQTTRDVQVTGGNVPATATAAVLNVTVTNTSAASFLSIWPSGQARPFVSSLNWGQGQTIPNAVTVKLGAGGKISVFNPTGNVDVIIDVVGYFESGTGLKFHPLAPARIQDSRSNGPQVGPYSTPWGNNSTRDVVVAGHTVVATNGVPSNAGAVLLNVTITGPSAASFLTVWPDGQSRPLASSLNWTAGITIPNAVTVKVGTLQQASFYNSSGSVHVIADVGGYYL